MNQAETRVLVVGNMGYVGPAVVNALRARAPHAELHGLDTGFFAGCLTSEHLLPETSLNQQWFMDIRDVPAGLLEGFEAVVYLAAVSNDPIGEEFRNATQSINYDGACRFARLAKESGVRRFVFASSCSMYGAAGPEAKTEDSPLTPLTTYAKTKVQYESFLKGMADEMFCVTALRFATACGMSPRLRLDLVLNDFVATAHTTGKIVLLSDGEAWRPLIDVKDMAQAVCWALDRAAGPDDIFLPVNVGRNDWNFRIIELAEIVSREFDGIDLEVGKGQSDKRTYRVDFDRYESLAGEFIEPRSVTDTIQEIKQGLERIRFNDPEFRASSLMRLNALKRLKTKGLLNEELRWT